MRSSGVSASASLAARPLPQVEAREDRGQLVRMLETRGDDAHRITRARRQRAARAEGAGGDVIENDALADVRAANDGHDQVGIRPQLRNELFAQQSVPLSPFERRQPQQSDRGGHVCGGRLNVPHAGAALAQRLARQTLVGGPPRHSNPGRVGRGRSNGSNGNRLSNRRNLVRVAIEPGRRADKRPAPLAVDKHFAARRPIFCRRSGLLTVYRGRPRVSETAPRPRDLPQAIAS